MDLYLLNTMSKRFKISHVHGVSSAMELVLSPFTAGWLIVCRPPYMLTFALVIKIMAVASRGYPWMDSTESISGRSRPETELEVICHLSIYTYLGNFQNR